MKHPHISLNEPELIEFKESGFGNDEYPERNRENHANELEKLYKLAISKAKSRKASIQDNPTLQSSGTYLEMTIGKKMDLSKIDGPRGARLMNIKNVEDDAQQMDVTIFLSEERENWLKKKLDVYRIKDNRSGTAPSNIALINNIDKVSASSLQAFFLQPHDWESIKGLPSDAYNWYEIWLGFDNEDYEITPDFDKIKICCSETNENYSKFAKTAVILVKATKTELTKLVYSLDNLSEIRIFREAATLISGSMTEQTEWLNHLEGVILKDSPQAIIGILDSGVFNSHQLLKEYLPDDRCHNVTKSPNISDRVRGGGHGTLLAGLALYGDFSDVIHNVGQLRVQSELSSVKIFDGDSNFENEKSLYGVIAEDAIITARADKAIVQCSAITSVAESLDGTPSEWSSAIDQTLYNNGEPYSLLLLSAGNNEDTNGLPYPDYIINASIKDPAQSWNSIAVGAYTEKVAIQDPTYQNIQAVAPRGGLSPFTTSSVAWGKSLIKPEIVMEGGNGTLRDEKISDTPDELVLASTAASPIHPFNAIYATSAATALAAKLASQIQINNPELSALAIRALLVHSAEWTDAMKEIALVDGHLNMDVLVHTCGYGVPKEQKAIASSDSYAVFIAENKLNALVKASNDKYKIGHMHLYEMPWPQKVLEGLGEEEITLKITLSYYIEPSPGSKTRNNKYRYPSLRLAFDINRPTETKEDFVQRVSHINRNDGEEKIPSSPIKWTIGTQRRDQGSLISDSITDVAVNIASCKYIGVYAKSGWWNRRRYTEDKGLQYALIVSIETKETEIYTEIVQPISIPIEA